MRFCTAVGSGLLALALPLRAEAQDDHSLTLSEVVTTARARSADAKEARANAEGASSAVDQAYSGYLPSLSANVDGNRGYQYSYIPSPTTGAMTGTPSAAWNTHLGATLNWTAWDFGRTTSTVAGAKASSRSADARAATSSNDIARQAAILFLTAVFDEELVGVAEGTLRLREKHANLVKAMVGVGMRPPIEEARARVELLLAKLDVTKATQRLAEDRIQVLTLLQMSPQDQVKFVRPSILPTLTADARRAAEQALKNRPEVQDAEASVEAQQENVDLAKAGRMPSIGVALSGDHRTNQTDDDARIFPTRSFTAMATVNIPIFDWSVWGKIPVARAGFDAAQARASGVRTRVQGEAAESAYQLQNATVLLDQAKTARELAGATLAVMEARYQAGRDGPYDLFEAANKDREARTQTIQAELALAAATVSSLAATGRLQELVR